MGLDNVVDGWPTANASEMGAANRKLRGQVTASIAGLSVSENAGLDTRGQQRIVSLRRPLGRARTSRTSVDAEQPAVLTGHPRIDWAGACTRRPFPCEKAESARFGGVRRAGTRCKNRRSLLDRDRDSTVAHSATSGACPSGERTERKGESRPAVATVLVPAALSSGLRRSIGFDAHGCSVLTALGSSVGSSRQRGGGGKAPLPVGRGGELRRLAAVGGVARWCGAAPAEVASASRGECVSGGVGRRRWSARRQRPRQGQALGLSSELPGTRLYHRRPA